MADDPKHQSRLLYLFVCLSTYVMVIEMFKYFSWIGKAFRSRFHYIPNVSTHTFTIIQKNKCTSVEYSIICSFVLSESDAHSLYSWGQSFRQCSEWPPTTAAMHTENKQNNAGNVRITQQWGAFVQTTVVVEKQYYIPWACVCSLRHPTCNAHAPYCHLWPVPLYNIHYKKKWTRYDQEARRSSWTVSTILARF